jgi:hypothetical protein
VLRIIIIASGKEYQNAAALAASTFAVHVRSPRSISVLLPASEEASVFLTRHSREFGYVIERFPFIAKHAVYFTSQLKCQAFAWQTARLGQKEVALFADADTCCLKPIRLPISVNKKILSGRIGLVPDIADRHFRDPSATCYLAPEERSIYVNSGIIFASGQAQAFFARIRNLSEESRFLCGPLHDQKVINFALGKHFPGLLLPLDRKFNTIGTVCPETVIAHFAGGAGYLAQQERRHHHERMCLTVLSAWKRPSVSG